MKSNEILESTVRIKTSSPTNLQIGYKFTNIIRDIRSGFVDLWEFDYK